MKPVIMTLMLCITLSGCAVFQNTPQNIITMPKTVGLMPFSSAPDKIVGQMAADRIALEMIANGYEIIDRSLTTSVVNETKFYSSGLNEEARKSFQAQNIPAILFGSVSKYGCETVNSTSFFGGHARKNRCTVSLAAKIAESSTGRLLWGLTISDSAEGESITAEGLMISLIQKAGSNGALPAPLPESKGPEISSPKSK